VIDAALRKANIKRTVISTFTQGPGLGSLLVGSSFAKSIALALKFHCTVNHMQAHVLAHFIDEDGYENQHSLFGVDYKWWTYSDFKVDHF
jgi:N6-L-threonylcarbamoyladenine synthase